MSKLPLIVNRTKYPTVQVKRIIAEALRGWPWSNDTSDWYTITVRYHTTGSRSGEGITQGGLKNGKVRTTISIGEPNQYPNLQQPHYGKTHYHYYYRSWQEALYQITAHESYHVWEGKSATETRAENYGLHKLHMMRLRHLFGLIPF